MLTHPHAAALEQRHARTDRLIGDELSRPACNDLRVGELKRRKLALKDEIVVLASGASA